MIAALKEVMRSTLGYLTGQSGGGGGGGIDVNVAAHSGGMVNAPSMSGCTVNGPLTFSYAGVPSAQQGGCEGQQGDPSPKKCKTPAEDLEEFDLKKHSRSEEGLKKMLHKVKVRRRVRLNQCNLSKASCEMMASVLQESSYLRELDMSGNYLQDEGVELLCVGLRVPQCKLETLRLCGCLVSHKGCSLLASALKSNPSHLKHLDLSYNHPGDSGIRELTDTLNDLNCKLQTLRLNQCQLSKESCEMIASVLQGTPSHLRELDMSDNDLQDEGVELLCVGLRDPQCKLETLRLSQCHLSKASCESMASVLQGKTSHLRELDMSVNDLQDEGVELLCVGLGDPQCKLETLRLSGCLISHKGCSCLTSALKSNPNYLKELDLTYNHPGKTGVRELSDHQSDPNCKLETFRFEDAGEGRMKPGPRKYACELTLDPNTAHRRLSLSGGSRTVRWQTEEQPYDDRSDRFDYWVQVLCREGQSGRCYWEAEWSGDAAEIAVAYKSVRRKGERDDSGFGRNAKSWRLNCSGDRYSAVHNKTKIAIPAPSSGSRRVGVYLDRPAGTLSFYRVSSGTLTLLHTFHSMFEDTEPLCPGFGFEYCVSNSSVSLCQIT
ncbi:ribonuclease inhibitor-like [Sardina pilchardus]|uniref:ribonuclease inhibitor-like n=1 Tax=Sardina pilchardus TaxID=27697 RepID=UPI002E1476AE